MKRQCSLILIRTPRESGVNSSVLAAFLFEAHGMENVADAPSSSLTGFKGKHGILTNKQMTVTLWQLWLCYVGTRDPKQ